MVCVFEQIGCHGEFDKNVFEACEILQWYMLEENKHSTNITKMTSFPSSNTTSIITEADTIQKIEHFDDSIKTQTSTPILNKSTNEDGFFVSYNQQQKCEVIVELVNTCTEDSRMACQYLQQASATQILPCECGTTHVSNGSTESRASLLHDSICNEHNQRNEQDQFNEQDQCDDLILKSSDLNSHADNDIDNHDELGGKSYRQDHHNCACKIDPDKHSHDIQSNDFGGDVNLDYGGDIDHDCEDHDSLNEGDNNGKWLCTIDAGGENCDSSYDFTINSNHSSSNDLSPLTITVQSLTPSSTSTRSEIFLHESLDGSRPLTAADIPLLVQTVVAAFSHPPRTSQKPETVQASHVSDIGSSSQDEDNHDGDYYGKSRVEDIDGGNIDHKHEDHDSNDSNNGQDDCGGDIDRSDGNDHDGDDNQESDEDSTSDGHSGEDDREQGDREQDDREQDDREQNNDNNGSDGDHNHDSNKDNSKDQDDNNNDNDDADNKDGEGVKALQN